MNNVYEFPVALRPKERILNDEDFCVPEAEEVIEGDNKEEVVEPVEDLVLPDGLAAADAGDVSAGERLSARAEVPSGSTDVRGL